MQDFLENLDLNTYDFSKLIEDATNILNNVNYLDSFTRTFYNYLIKILYLRYDVWKFLLKPEQKKYMVDLIFICLHFLNVKDFFMENFELVKLSSTIDLVVYRINYCSGNITFEMFVINELYEALKDNKYTIQNVSYKDIQLKELAYTIKENIIFEEVDKILRYIMYGYKIVMTGNKCELFEHPYFFELIEIKEEPKIPLPPKIPVVKQKFIESNNRSYWNCLNSYELELEYFINDDINGFLEYILYEEKTDDTVHKWFVESLLYKSIKIFKYLYMLENFYEIIRDWFIIPVWDNEMYRLLQSLYLRNNHSEEDFIRMCDIDLIIKANNYELINYFVEKELFSLRTELIIYIPLVFKDKYPIMKTSKLECIIENGDTKFYIPNSYDTKDNFECAMTILNYKYKII